MYIIVPNFIMVGTTVAELSQYFDFQSWRPSTILNFKVLLFGACKVKGPECVGIPNFIEIGHTVFEISRFLNGTPKN